MVKVMSTATIKYGAKRRKKKKNPQIKVLFIWPFKLKYQAKKKSHHHHQRLVYNFCVYLCTMPNVTHSTGLPQHVNVILVFQYRLKYVRIRRIKWKIHWWPIFKMIQVMRTRPQIVVLLFSFEFNSWNVWKSF